MAPDDIRNRLFAIEGRLSQIEDRLGMYAAPRKQAPQRRADTPAPGSLRTATPRDRSGLITSILGWGGLVALVLAASYLIRLGIDNGWLTPVRQVALATVAGALLIGSGFPMRNVDARYAGYLPAGGIVILFLAIYGGHLFYGFISLKVAALAVIFVCGLSLWLCRVFDSDLYALFAVAGSYTAPILLHGAHGSLTDLVIYFSAWSVVFSIYAIWRGKRLIYLVAMYMALVGFDVIWRANGGHEWPAALMFQTVQFIVFGSATAIFSVQRQEPMDTNVAVMHLPPLLLFYALQYNLLDQHLHSFAPWIAVVSLGVLAALYFSARALLGRELPGGELLLWAYVALILFHAVYLESVPKEWAPWVALLLVPIAAAGTLMRKRPLGAMKILWGAVGLIFLLNFISVVLDLKLEQVPGRYLLSTAYAALLYAGYYAIHEREGLQEIKRLLVYAGHLSAMATAVHLLDTRILESAVWGVLALGCIGISVWKSDRLLGQSSLLLFGATAIKVLTYDLSNAPPVVRILSLVVLGITFYVGGLLYQRMIAPKVAGS